MITTDTFTGADAFYMRRALQIASAGLGHVFPNPMVGAVVVAHDGRIIGEGWHRRYGQAHAEVNAIASVADADKHLLNNCTVYVTLEPCSHYGKTPPCAKLLVDTNVKRVVAATVDPNPLVAGRGMKMLKDAGIEIAVGLMEDESRALNKIFFTAHTEGRPFITLKWAESADAFMAKRDNNSTSAPVRLSSNIGALIVQLRRARHQAIAVGANTVITDSPRLTVRNIVGSSPTPIVFDRHHILSGSEPLLNRPDTILLKDDIPLANQLSQLYSNHGITSILVEGGANLLQHFIDADLWDEAFIERANFALADDGAIKAPTLNFCVEQINSGNTTISHHANPKNPFLKKYFKTN